MLTYVHDICMTYCTVHANKLNITLLYFSFILNAAALDPCAAPNSRFIQYIGNIIDKCFKVQF